MDVEFKFLLYSSYFFYASSFHFDILNQKYLIFPSKNFLMEWRCLSAHLFSNPFPWQLLNSSWNFNYICQKFNIIKYLTRRSVLKTNGWIKETALISNHTKGKPGDSAFNSTWLAKSAQISFQICCTACCVIIVCQNQVMFSIWKHCKYFCVCVYKNVGKVE